MSQQLSLFAGPGKPAANWTKADPALLERKEVLKAGGPPGWRPNRLILMNYWHFTYEEFHFVQGRLVLRGSNGSGKSTALAAAITLTLDGEKRRERMDTFGGQGRSVAYYLVGHQTATPESDFYYQERTAYIVLEFEHATQGRYASIGVGLYTSRGRPNLDVDFWGFTIADGRRPGFDLALFDDTADGRVPLTARQLKERIGPGGQLTDRQGQYQAMVNDLLFGMPEEEYDDLLKVLVHLRSPKLNKDIKPSDVCQMLVRSLPSLQEDLLAQVTRIIEDIDSQQDLLAQTQRHLAAVREIDEKLDRYLNQLAQEAALDYREARAEVAGARGRLEQASTHLKKTEEELQRVRCRLASIQEERTEKSGRLEALERSSAFAQEKDLEQAERDRNEAQATLHAAGDEVAKSREALDRLTGELNTLLDDWGRALESLQSKGAVLVEAAQAAAWPLAEKAARDATERLIELRLGEQRLDPSVALTPVTQLGQERLGALRQALSAALNLEDLQQKYDVAKASLQRAENERNHAADQLSDAEEKLDQVREVAVGEAHAWRSVLVELSLPAHGLDGLVQGIREYPANGVELSALAERETAEPARRALAVLQQQRSEKQVERATFVARQERLKEELQGWLDRTEAEPSRGVGQEQARRLLFDHRISAVPLFAACDFRPELSAPEAALVEAALAEAGLLDALVIPAARVTEVEQLLHAEGVGDRWVKPTPVSTGTTLADWLVPAPCALKESDILAALRSISVTADATGMGFILKDGRWQVGPLAGTSTVGDGVAEVRYVGLENRRRRREAELDRIRKDLRQVQEQIKGLDNAINELMDRMERVGEEREALRRLAIWDQLYKAGSQRTGAEQWLERCKSAVNRELSQQRGAYEALLAAKGRWQEIIEQVPECRGRNAEGVRLALDATQRLVMEVGYFTGQLGGLDRMHRQWQSDQRNLQDAEGRLRTALDRQSKDRARFQELNARAEALLERIVGLGLEELRKQVTDLREQIAEMGKEERGLLEEHGGLKTAAETARQAKLVAERAVSNTEASVSRYLQKLAERLAAYPTLESDLARVREGEDSALACAEDLLKLRRTASEGLREAIKGSQKEALRFLSDAFAAHKSDLVEFRPDLEGDLVIFRDLGARLLPCELRRRLEGDHQHQLMIVREKENELYEEFILRQVASHIRELVGRVEDWKERVNGLLEKRKLTNAEILSIDWRPLPADRVTGIDMARVVSLLRQDPDKLREEEITELVSHFRSRVDEVRRREKRGEQEQSFADALAEVLDYRLWFDFTLHSKLPSQPRQLMTDIRFTARSGAEKSLAMFIPLLAAAHARYETARPDAPRLVGLDEAFAGVDEQNTKEMFRFLVELNFSWIMTSEKLWGVADTLPGCSTYELIRRGSVVTPIFYLWDGTRRHGSLESSLGEVATTSER